MNFNKLQVKEIIALSIALALILFTGYGMFVEKVVPTEYMSIATMIIGYYFGRNHGEER